MEMEKNLHTKKLFVITVENFLRWKIHDICSFPHDKTAIFYCPKSNQFFNDVSD